MLPASLGGDQAVEVGLDTGAGVSVLSKSLVRKLGGRAAGAFTGFRLTGERLDLELFTIPSLRIGPVLQRNVLVAGWDELDKLHLAGLVSLSFFRDHPFTLDLPGRRLTFETAATLASRQKHGEIIPVQLNDMRGISIDLFAPFSWTVMRLIVRWIREVRATCLRLGT